ncbi:serine/threonine-protein kinase hal4 [Hypoxylon trugodes]|uniref:serine/threonine-protein kinase hal4 n=1 Tax=Hypoxylon trugodes TaxID=326681 RepID=UPI00219FABB9|nr:serine/threonine-protein kinase hal4 [Hypoxylon trugodes]KAI1384688.1 serine/threonine-protein kinase hal4 [Hypoxylon trugodes]
MSSASEKTVSPSASKQSSIKSVELSTRSPKLRPQNGQSINDNPHAEGQPRQPEKASIKDRLTRMFSNKDDLPRSGLVDISQPSKRAAPSPSPSQIGVNNAPAKPSALARKPSSAEAPNVSKPAHHQRFVVNSEVPGGHEHHLKGSKRQEKLSDMWKTLLGRKQDQQPEADLSLVSSWVDTLKQEKESLAGDKRGGPNQSITLVEKYGKCQEVVGRGAFGIVRISHKKIENGEKLFAVKEFRRRPEETEKKYSKRLTAEFCISSSLRHPNIIHTLDLLKDQKGDYCEVMEYCSGGDLYTLVLAAGKLEVAEADCYFKQMMRGVEYLHEMGVAHRDLKPENLLLTSHGALKITDFGNGECFRMAWENDAHMVSGLCGSAPYIAPEEYIDKEFDARAVDVWACGVIYMAMRTGRHLWRVAKKDEDEFYERYLEGRRDEEGYGPIESLHRARCRNVIYSILDPNPTRRITASQVLKSEWGREIKLCKAGEEGL